MYLAHERRAGVTLLGEAAPATTSIATATATVDPSLPLITDASESPTPLDHSVLVAQPTETSTQGPKSKVGETETNSVDIRPIVGAAVGGAVLLALIAVAIWFFLRRRKQRQTRDIDHMSRDTAPMLGSNGVEKFAMDHSPEFGENGEERRSGGVFAPFGGYHKTPSVEAREEEEEAEADISLERPGHSLEIEDDPLEDAYIPNHEKGYLDAPPVESHPAFHPLPGQSADIPTYYPGGLQPIHPAYTIRNLPSQRDPHPKSIALPGQRLPERSPEIPEMMFSPIDLVRGNSQQQDDVAPPTPKAELAAFPSPPTTIPSTMAQLPAKQQLRRSLTPPKKQVQRPQRPRRQSTPPRHSAPLDRLTPPHLFSASPSPAPRARDLTLPTKSMTKKGLHISGIANASASIPRTTTPAVRPTVQVRVQTYPSPTAGGRPELPASFPPAKPERAFNHISLPSPVPSSPSPTLLRTASSSYSIPIGLASSLERQNSPPRTPANPTNWPLANTDTPHDLRNQSSAVSALSQMRDLHNSSAVSALSIRPAATPLQHNHSAHSEHAHVMSWEHYSSQTHSYSHTPESAISPMFSPSGPGNGMVSPMTVRGTPLVENAGHMLSVGGVLGGRTPSVLRGAKTPSMEALRDRARERERDFGDLKVRPLAVGAATFGNLGESRSGAWGELNKKKEKRVPSEVLLNGSRRF